MDLVGALTSSIAESARHIDDTWVDRLSHQWSVAIFVIFVIVISTKQYVGDPIECWCPAYFNQNYLQYADHICWVSNTYYIPMTEGIPDDDNLKPHLTYYQWTPFILLAQACLFYIPCLFWRSLNDKSGISLANMIEASKEYQKATKTEEKDKMIKYMTKHLDRHLDIRGKRQVEHRCRRICCCRRQGGAYLGILYIIVKILYFSNALSQLFLLNYFLGTNFHMYGISVARKLFRGEDWSESAQFPRVTLCDFKVRQLGNTHRHTVQCVLPVNLFNEKIFIFVWVWLALTSFFSFGSLVAWLWRILWAKDRMRYVLHRISTVGEPLLQEHRPLLKCFVKHHLKEDGVLILRLISKNSSDIVAAEILYALWENFRDFKLHRDGSGAGKGAPIEEGETAALITTENNVRPRRKAPKPPPSKIRTQ